MKIERMRTAFGRIAGIVVLSGALCTAWAQPALKTVLKSHMNLAAFGAGSGNDCWGYTSPSGREYALMGLNNQVAFVEVTTPSSPVIIEQISHTASLWADITVYGHYAYVVTEAGGTGIQVIDMSDIDNGNVTLTRTITNPGRSHDIVLDEENGFLYTVGSNQSLGTTMCFDLTDPSNPVRVGANSITENYIHDAQVVTWRSGALAGRQLFFGCSEGRGIDIYDVTDKNAPVLIKRVTYPNIGYCHQGWLSDDHRFFFVDDEFDESNLNAPTRSLMFNVEDPANAYFVSTFTSGNTAIDHNQFVADGFTFQANYRSGLRIFDVSNAPEIPFQVGYYDTYLANDLRGYNGAWSCYPYFKSGIVLISDIETGLYIVDPSEATTRMKAPSIAELLNARLISGGVGNTEAPEGSTFNLTHGTLTNVDRSVIDVAFEVQAYDTSPMGIKMMARAKGNVSGYRQDILLYDWSGTDWVVINSSNLTPAFTNSLGTATGALSRFVHPGTKTVRGRLRYTPVAANTQKLVLEIDQVQFQITR